jgi:ankyrin repeat protein
MQKQTEKFMSACIKDDVPEVKRLLLIVHPATENGKGYNAIDVACIHGSINVVSFLIKSYPKIISHTNSRGFTPSHAASRYGKTAIVRLLIQNGAKNSPSNNKYKTTPLMSANETKTNLLNNKNIPAGASNNSSDYAEIIDMWTYPKKVFQKASASNATAESNSAADKPAPWASIAKELSDPEKSAPNFAEIVKDQSVSSFSNSNPNLSNQQSANTNIQHIFGN